MPIFVYIFVFAGFGMGLIGILSYYRERNKKLEIERIKVLNDTGRFDITQAESQRLQAEIRQLREEQEALKKHFRLVVQTLGNATGSEQLTQNFDTTLQPQDPDRTTDTETAQRIAALAQKLNRQI